MDSLESADECARWLQRVSHVQLERITPEAREQLRAHAERQREAESARRSCRSMSMHALRSRSLVHEGLQQMSLSQTSAEFSAVSNRWRLAQRRSTELAEQTVYLSECFDAHVEETSVWRDEEAEAEQLAETSRLVGSTNLEASTVSALAETQGIAEPLLAQLSEEPADDEEALAKFAMYETYSEEVGRMHDTLFDFHARHRESLPLAVDKDMESQLKAVDCINALGIPDDARHWFVYHMMKQASNNNGIMGRVLKDFERKLEFLARDAQSDCPICLESFTDDRPAETLGCCHGVCRACWQHWAAVRHGHPFCPLCRQNEFLHILATEAGDVTSRVLGHPQTLDLPTTLVAQAGHSQSLLQQSLRRLQRLSARLCSYCR